MKRESVFSDAAYSISSGAFQAIARTAKLSKPSLMFLLGTLVFFSWAKEGSPRAAPAPATAKDFTKSRRGRFQLSFFMSLQFPILSPNQLAEGLAFLNQ